MKFYIKKKGAFTLEIMRIIPHEDTLFIDIRGFNSAIDKKLITTDDLRKLCMNYGTMNRVVMSDYDYAPENAYILTINNYSGNHKYSIVRNNEILVKAYL